MFLRIYLVEKSCCLVVVRSERAEQGARWIVKIETFKYYKTYKNYNKYNLINMQNTTIAINQWLKEEIEKFGTKGESYSQILERLLKSAKERMLYDVLMDEKECISIEEALAQAKKRWQEW